jgi:hypothetical protein
LALRNRSLNSQGQAARFQELKNMPTTDASDVAAKPSRLPAESREAALSNTVGDRIRFEVKTNHFIIPMSVGPQVMWPTGIVRPYMNAGVGAQVFETDSHAEAVSGESLTITTDQSDVAPLWVVGGGIYMPIYNGKTKVSLDFGMQYLNGGNAQYQTSGSIIDLPNAQIKLNPSRSVTHMIVVRFGARIGL